MRAIFPPDDEGELRLVREFLGEVKGYFVEVGAFHAEQWSQTYHLEQRGWTGVLVEPQPDLAAAIRQRRKAQVFAVACSSPANAGRTMSLQSAGPHSSLNRRLVVETKNPSGTIAVPTRTLDEVLKEAKAPVPLDFVSIDVEGHEIEVLEGFDLPRWRPRLLLVEDMVLSRRLHHALVARGYRWVRRIGVNSWYVPAPAAIPVSLLGRLQFVRKYYLAVPFRRCRQALRRLRFRLGLTGGPA
jgi:FkbM family methyltransferase